MVGVIKVQLKPGERIFVNGAILRADRKVTLALENEATFLIESQVLDATEAATPLRRHYLAVQALMIEPARRDELMEICRASHRMVAAAYGAKGEVGVGLAAAAVALEADRPYEALRLLKALIAREDATLPPTEASADVLGGQS
ncbi:MAG: flagellar biosynthesis repressor FlbT [Hyphomicrobiaceae bacterium]